MDESYKRQRAGTDLIQGSTYWWSHAGGILVTVKHIFGSQAQVIHSTGVAFVYTSELYLPTVDDLTAGQVPKRYREKGESSNG